MRHIYHLAMMRQNPIQLDITVTVCLRAVDDTGLAGIQDVNCARCLREAQRDWGTNQTKWGMEAKNLQHLQDRIDEDIIRQRKEILRVCEAYGTSAVLQHCLTKVYVDQRDIGQTMQRPPMEVPVGV